MPLSVDNSTVIRVWTSGLNGGESVGHISIETPNQYMSFWPGDAPPIKKTDNFFKKRTAHFMDKYEDDLTAEDRPPEIIVCFYSLNVQLMEQKFTSIACTIENWTLLGSNRLIQKEKSQHENCASLAMRILQEGGIYNLLPSFTSSKFVTTIPPDLVARILPEAKRTELEYYPETQTFSYTNETNLETLNQLYSDRNSSSLICSII